jgi:hypothetical protein
MLTRDQVRLIRGMIYTATNDGAISIPLFDELRPILDNAEDTATVEHAKRRTPVVTWLSPQERRDQTLEAYMPHRPL